MSLSRSSSTGLSRPFSQRGGDGVDPRAWSRPHPNAQPRDGPAPPLFPLVTIGFLTLSSGEQARTVRVPEGWVEEALGSRPRDSSNKRRFQETLALAHGVRCPVCGTGDRITTRKGGFYRCNQCKQDFTLRTGTIFGRWHVPLHKRIYARYLVVTRARVSRLCSLPRDRRHAEAGLVCPRTASGSVRRQLREAERHYRNR
jgi:DNA-directed RNA polymerase subunit RPC12/RpoP